MSVTNPAPSLVTPTVTPAVDSASFKYTKPTDLDYAGIKIHASTSSGFTSDDTTLIYFGVDNPAVVSGLVPNTTYYYQVTVTDEFGDGPQTSEASFSTTQLPEAGLADDSVTTDKVVDGNITNAKINDVIADKITAGTVTGSTIQTATTGKRFVVTASVNEAEFYGDRGDGTVEKLATIGINNVGGDTIILVVGGDNSQRSGILSTTKNTSVYAGSFKHKSGGDAIFAESSFGHGVLAATASSTKSGLRGDNLGSGPGIIGFSISGTAGEFIAGSATSRAIKTTTGYSDLSSGPVKLKSYTVAGLPTAAFTESIIYVSDETGGATLAFSDGTNWRRVQDRAVVS